MIGSLLLGRGFWLGHLTWTEAGHQDRIGEEHFIRSYTRSSALSPPHSLNGLGTLGLKYRARVKKRQQEDVCKSPEHRWARGRVALPGPRKSGGAMRPFWPMNYMGRHDRCHPEPR